MKRISVIVLAGVLIMVSLYACSSKSGCLSESESTDSNTMDKELYVFTQQEIVSPEWVSRLPAAQDMKNSQMVVVAAMGMDKTTASISMHERDSDGRWIQVLSTPGFVGEEGMCKDEEHREGIYSCTPIGTYKFNKAFGIADDPGCSGFDYVKVDDNIYWSGDDREGMHYNEMVDIRDFPDLEMENSEHIIDYDYEYRYCLNISFNEDAIPGKGSAIFMHCFGRTEPCTGGCVAVPEYTMIQILQRVKHDCVVVIDTLENMNNT